MLQAFKTKETVVKKKKKKTPGHEKQLGLISVIIQ